MPQVFVSPVKVMAPCSKYERLFLKEKLNAIKDVEHCLQNTKGAAKYNINLVTLSITNKVKDQLGKETWLMPACKKFCYEMHLQLKEVCVL